MTGLELAVLVIDRSPWRIRVLVTVETLFAVFVSEKFAGAVTVAVFVKALASDAASTLPVTVNVAVPFFGSVTAVLILPEPDAVPVAPPV